MRFESAQWWIGTAFAANLFLAAIILFSRGAGVHGTETALVATARAAFPWFWTAYVGGALTTLFGPAFQPLKRHGREFGLAFAAAILVHILLVGWLCWIGSAPGKNVFILFGTAAAVSFLLAGFSIGNLQAALGQKMWQLLRAIGMNFILYAFLTDFVQIPSQASNLQLIEYLFFAAMAIAAPLLRLAAWGFKIASSRSIATGRIGHSG